MIVRVFDFTNGKCKLDFSVPDVIEIQRLAAKYGTSNEDVVTSAFEQGLVAMAEYLIKEL